MNTRILDSPTKRISIAVAVMTGLIVVAAAGYLFLGSSSPSPVNGFMIIAAAHNYTHALVQRHVLVPQSVPLQTLVDQGLLKPDDIGAFQGLEATIFLTAPTNGPPVLMRVRMPDGTDYVLLADGKSLLEKPGR